MYIYIYVYIYMYIYIYNISSSKVTFNILLISLFFMLTLSFSKNLSFIAFLTAILRLF